MRTTLVFSGIRSRITQPEELQFPTADKQTHRAAYDETFGRGPRSAFSGDSGARGLHLVQKTATGPTAAPRLI